MDVILKVLVHRVRVHGGHQAAVDAEAILQHLGHRGQAVGGAAGIGNDVVLLGIVLIVVDAQANGNILAFGRRTNNYLLAASGDMGPRLFRVGEATGRLDHDIDVEVAPGQIGRIALGQCPDFHALVANRDDELVFRRLDLALELAIGAVVAQQMSQCFVIGQIVNRDDFNLVGIALQNRLEHLTTNASKAVDCNSCHLHRSL